MGGKPKASGKEKAAEKEKEKVAQKTAAQEDAEWQAAGEGKKTKAQAKKESAEASRSEAALKKAEAKKMLEEEEARLSSGPKATSGPSKATQHQLLQQRLKDESIAQAEKTKRDLERRREMGEEDYLRMIALENENANSDAAEARTVEAALAVLGVAEEVPKLKFSEYVERELPELKVQKPGLKAPQYKDMLWKKWQRSPENPLNAKVA